METTDKQETGALETMQLLSDPELVKKIIEGKNTPLSECVSEGEVEC